MNPQATEQYADAEGFLDVDELIRDKKIDIFFPGLLPEVDEIRKRDFPLFDQKERIYLDTTATSQEPQSVKDRMYQYRKSVIRGSNHSKNSAEAREAQSRFEEAREKIQKFFRADNYHVIFTSGTTNSSNWIAKQFDFRRGDMVLIPLMEHHSQMLTHKNLAGKNDIPFKFVPVTRPEGRLDLEALEKIIAHEKNKKRILMNLTHVSNVSGVVNPVKNVKSILGKKGLIYLDIAQSAGHMPIDLDKLDVDFAGVSSHKMYGPMGIGALFIKKGSEQHLHGEISGGSAVRLVSRYAVAHADAPAKFEPGTQDIEGAIEWGFALDYLSNIGMDRIEQHDKALGHYFMNEVRKIPGITVLGPNQSADRASLFTFVVRPAKSLVQQLPLHVTRNYDKIAVALDNHGISVRDGCFCAHIYVAHLLELQSYLNAARTVLMKTGVNEDMFKLPGGVRVSFSFYNTLGEAYRLIQALKEVQQSATRFF
jgi:cysteine desulfurase/selenocysteine lyase